MAQSLYIRLSRARDAPKAGSKGERIGIRGGHSAIRLAGIGGNGAGFTQVVEGAQAVRRQAALSAVRRDITGHLFHLDVPALNLSGAPALVVL